MANWQATAVACANAGLIQQWGVTDAALNLPANGSISLTLAGLEVTTTVHWRVELTRDRITLDGQAPNDALARRITIHLDHVRRLSGQSSRAEVTIQSTFSPRMGLNIAAPLFASLSMAATAAAGVELSMRALTALARLGAGSACQSIPGGFVEWHTGATHEASCAESIAGAEHWPLVDLIAVVSGAGRHMNDITEGHRLAATSPLQATRLLGAAARLAACREAILMRDFERLAAAAELDTGLVHAIAITSSPAVFYWAPVTLTILERVRAWRAAGLAVCYSVDPGPNVHCLCEPGDAANVEVQLGALRGILDVRRATSGGPARLVEPG